MLFVTQIQDSYIGMAFPGRENKKSAQRHKPSDALKHGNYIRHAADNRYFMDLL